MARPSAWVLAVANAVPIAGVLLWGWSIFEVVFLYWLENVIVGAINVLRMMSCRTGGSVGVMLAEMAKRRGREIPAEQVENYKAMKAPGAIIKVFLIPFFMFHYGMFCYGHGVFVFALFGNGTFLGPGAVPTNVIGVVTSPVMLLAAGSLLASHLYSFLHNFIGRGEYRRTTPFELMSRPYGRIVALHLAIILGAFLATFLGNPIGVLLVLVAAKTFFDLRLHRSERVKFARHKQQSSAAKDSLFSVFSPSRKRGKAPGPRSSGEKTTV
jgi:hypothetical protein